MAVEESNGPSIALSLSPAASFEREAAEGRICICNRRLGYIAHRIQFRDPCLRARSRTGRPTYGVWHRRVR